MDTLSRFFFLLPLTLFLTLNPSQVLSANETGIDLIRKTCDHTLYKSLCMSSLQSDPNSLKTDLKGLATIAINLAKANATDTSEQINKLFNTTTDPFIQDCLTDCSENYADAVDQLGNSIAALDSKAYNDVNTWVTAAMTDADTCEEGFTAEPGHKLVLGDRNTVFSQLCSNVLAITNLLAGA